jgi:hypothetical protein
MKTRSSSDDSPRPVARGLKCGAALALAGVLATSQAQAAFHFWNIRELYTDNSGSLQFIEFFCQVGSQQFVAGQSITVTPTGGGAPHTFTIPGSLPSDTLNKTFLIGTAGIQAAGSPAPDFIMPNGFLFPGGGTISFFGVFGNSPVVYSALSVDGLHSRLTFGGSGDVVNSPQSFASVTPGMITAVPEPSICTLLVIGGAGLCLPLRRRSA